MAIFSDGKGGVGDVAEAPVEAANQAYAKTSPGFTGFLGAFNQAENPTSLFLQRAEQSAYREHDWFRDFLNANVAASGGGDLMQYIPSPKLAPDDANKQFPNPDPNGKPMFSEPIESKLAETIAKNKAKSYQAETDMARFAQNHNMVTQFGAGMVATMLDPINIATAFVPGLGEERIAAMGLGVAGRMAMRAGEFGAINAAAQTPVIGAKLALADDLRSDYGIRDALRDMLMATGTGIVMGGAFGAASEGLRGFRGKPVAAEAIPVATANAETNHAATSTAVSQLVTGKPVDVEGFFPKPSTLAGLIDHPYMQEVKPTDLGLDRRDVARSIEPKIMERYDSLEQQRAGLAAHLEELNQASQRGETNAGSLIQDQIDNLNTQLAGKISKAKRSQAETKLADLQEQLAKVPTNADREAVQRQMLEIDGQLRDMTDAIAPVMKRADETIGRAQAAETGKRLEDLIAKQKQFVSIDQQSMSRATGYRPDPTGMIERELGWRQTGIAPGASHADLVAARGEVEHAATNAPKAPEPEKMPAEFGTTEKVIDLTGMGKGMTDNLYSGLFDSLRQGKNTFAGLRDPVLDKAKAAFDKGLIKSPNDLRNLVQANYDVERAGIGKEGATAGGEKPAATPAPETAKAPRKAPERFEDVYPELKDKGLSADERKDLMDAHRDLEAANNKVGAYDEVAKCLKAGG